MANRKIVARGGLRLMSLRSYSATIRSSPRNLWTSDKIVKSPFKDINVPNCTILEHIWKNLDRWADKTALICGISKHQYTYHQLYRYSKNLGANLRTKLKVVDGDVVCIMMTNSPDYSVAVLGVLESGAELTTVNPIYTAHEVAKQFLLSNVKVVIATAQTVPIVKEGLQIAKKDVPIIIVRTESETLPANTISFKEFIESDVDKSVLKEVARKSEDVAILPYSSGTTGLPKGVELTNRNIVANCLQQDAEGVKQYSETTDSYQEHVMAVLPFYHIYGMVITMLHKLSVGAKLVTLPNFHPKSFLTAMKEQKIRTLYAAPPLILFLATNDDVKKEHLEHLNKIMSGAAPLAVNDILKLLERTPSNTAIIQMYGLTETSPLATTNYLDSKNYTSSGFACSNTELKVVDSNMNNLGPDEVGEILIRGPQIMKGYRNNLEATKNAITEDGWLKSGDLAFIDKEGALTIADRLKELIKVKGYQVPPAELENVLKGHPAILDAGVVGIPDERNGEAPKAFIVLKEGQKVNTTDVLDYVKNRVAVFKRIKEIEVVDSLPKNQSGKLLRKVLREKCC